MKGYQHWISKRREKRNMTLFKDFRRAHDYARDIMKSPGFQRSRSFVQHGEVSVRKHSMNVALAALNISRFLPVKMNERDIVRGALLHDYFLYDWHKTKIRPNHIFQFYKLHGFSHPQTALKNAKKDFKLTQIEQEIIKKHMWPLTVKPPMCREAWVVTMADKYCSLLETLRIYH